MEIISYTNANDIIVELKNGYKSRVHSTYRCFKDGEIKNPYHRSVFEIGYIGDGIHVSSLNGKSIAKYRIWQNMLKRCYDNKTQFRQPTYEGCTVCDEWHNFQNFGKWFDENYYEVDNYKTQLDKDIIYKGNKIYSPHTCIVANEYKNKIPRKLYDAMYNYKIEIND